MKLSRDFVIFVKMRIKEIAKTSSMFEWNPKAGLYYEYNAFKADNEPTEVHARMCELVWKKRSKWIENLRNTKYSVPSNKRKF